MSMATPPPPETSLHPMMLPLVYAWRELRGGLRGFYVFIACIAIGVMAISGVGSVSRSLSDGLAREGRTILGGDIAYALVQREATSNERAFIAKQGDVSQAAIMRAMVKSVDGRLALAEIKAVDGAYPLTGQITAEPAQTVAQALAKNGEAHGALIDPALLLRLDLKIGEHVNIGEARFEIRGSLVSEPDKLAGGMGFGPRVLISIDALHATGLLQPGSLIRWLYRVRASDGPLSEAQTASMIEESRRAFPEAGWDIRSRANASPQLERNIERFTQFLTLVGLASLIVGGVGVANAVKGHIDRRRATIATLKSLGATGGRIFAIYLVQVLLLAFGGVLIGAVLGAVMPWLVLRLFGHLIPLPLEPALHLGELWLAVLYGLLTALAFALWPLGRAHDVPVSDLFRDNLGEDKRWPRRLYVLLTIGAIVLLTAIAVWLAYDRRIAMIFAAASFAVFVVLGLVASGLMNITKRLPRAAWPMVRLALANIHRPGALTPSVVLSLGLGVALLVTIVQIDFNLRRQFTAALPDHAPSFYFVDIPSKDAAEFDSFIAQSAPQAKVERVPMLRGRIISAGGVPAENLKPSPDIEWVLQSDRGITYATNVPDGSRITSGQWWGADYNGPPLVSFEKKIADGLGLKIGDPVRVNVLGRNIDVTIANLRTLDWQGLGINFVMVFSPNTFRGAPHTHIATLTQPDADAAEEARIMKSVASAFPSVTAVRVREALETIGGVVTNLILAIRGASAITLLAAVLVLGGALAAGRRQRVYDAVILKTLGATRARLSFAYLIEYAILGLTAGAFGVATGSLAAQLVVTQMMSLSFVWFPIAALSVTGAALVLTILLGFAGTLAALRQKPAAVLRHL